jgi:MoxR-like ATPase
MNMTVSTKDLLRSALIASYNYAEADKARDEAFDALKENLKDRFSLYERLFSQLAKKAKKLGYLFEEFHEDNEFDLENRKLLIVYPINKDRFLIVKSKSDSNTAYTYFPAKYLYEDWEEKMYQDAQRLCSELAAFEKEQKIKQDAEKEHKEKQEYERLKKKFGEDTTMGNGGASSEYRQPAEKTEIQNASPKPSVENLPSDCVSEKLAHGFFDESSMTIAPPLKKRIEKVRKNEGRLPLRMLGNREELADTTWWLNRIDGISKTLNARFPWMEKITERICNHLLFCGRFQTPIHIPPTLLVGQHGIGKTSYMNRLAELLRIRVHFVDVSTISAGWVLTGSDSTWREAKQGAILETLLDFAKPMEDVLFLGNPIIVLDEIDKESGSHRYSLNSSLLPLLEKATAQRFSDEFLRGMTWDISYVSFFATANDLHGISDPLLSRFQVMEVTPPTDRQKFDAVLRMVDEYGQKIRDEMRTELGDAFKVCLEDEDIAHDLAKIESIREIAWRLDDAVRRAVARDPLAEVFTLKRSDFDFAAQRRSFGFSMEPITHPTMPDEQRPCADVLQETERAPNTEFDITTKGSV